MQIALDLGLLKCCNLRFENLSLLTLVPQIALNLGPFFVLSFQAMHVLSLVPFYMRVLAGYTYTNALIRVCVIILGTCD